MGLKEKEEFVINEIKRAIKEEQESIMEVRQSTFSNYHMDEVTTGAIKDDAESRVDDIAQWDFDEQMNAVYSYAVIRTLEWLLTTIERED